MCVHVCACKYACVYMYVHVCACMCITMSVYILKITTKNNCIKFRNVFVYFCPFCNEVISAYLSCIDRYIVRYRTGQTIWLKSTKHRISVAVSC